MTGWVRLLGFRLARDKVALPVWVLSVAVFSVAFVPALPAMVGNPAELAALAEMMASPAMVAMCGLLYGDELTYGIIYTQMMLVWSGILVAVMNALLVIRHTRTDEEAGRLELVAAQPVGRLANLVAVGVLLVGANAVLGVLVAVGLAGFGVESVTWAGAAVYGAVLAACGVCFAGLTMVVVQVVRSARTAIGVALTLLSLFYVVRAAGDLGPETVARLSPLGLLERTFPFYTNRWWPVVVLVLAGVVLMVVAVVFNAVRELGEALLPGRGRGQAGARTLRGPVGLAWRLTGGMIVAWGTTVLLLSAAYGAVMNNMESFMQASPIFLQLIGLGENQSDIVAPIVGMLLLIMALIGTIPVLATAYHLGAEERAARLDYQLGTPTSRYRVYGGYAVMTAVVAVAMPALAGLGFWMVADAVMTDPVPARLVFTIAFNYGAALLAFGGLGLALVGWAKRLTWIGWAYLAITFLVVYLGDMIEVPRWLGRLTPFGLLPRWPTEDFSWVRWVGLVVGGVALAVAGAIGFRRRDITT